MHSYFPTLYNNNLITCLPIVVVILIEVSWFVVELVFEHHEGTHLYVTSLNDLSGLFDVKMTKETTRPTELVDLASGATLCGNGSIHLEAMKMIVN